jgi:hypothetical protein
METNIIFVQSTLSILKKTNYIELYVDYIGNHL